MMQPTRNLVEVIYVYDDEFSQSYCGKSLNDYVNFIQMGAAAIMREQQRTVESTPEPESNPGVEELPFLRNAP